VPYWPDKDNFTFNETKLEHRLRVFVNRVPKKISEPERDEATGEWKRLHIEDLYDQFYSPNIIRVIISRTTRWTGLVARTGVRRGAYRYLMGKPEGTRPLGRQVVGEG
jgi:hypothetical protein